MGHRKVESARTNEELTLPLESVSGSDRPRVGGKAASLGEMIQELSGVGIRVPGGFSTTADAFRAFLEEPVPAEPHSETASLAPPDQIAGLWDRLQSRLSGSSTLGYALRLLMDPGSEAITDDNDEPGTIAALARGLVRATPLPSSLEAAIRQGYAHLEERYGEGTDAAVRSSATVEDSELASFAGQYDSYLNIQGADAVVEAWRMCVASAFTERAISYQRGRDMDPMAGAVAVIVMKMVRSDLATSGVVFTLDPDSGNPNLIHVTSSYGLGELVVQGTVTPDTFLLWKDGLRRGHDALVHQELGAKDQKMIYSSQGGTATESVDVDASNRREWSISREDVIELGRMALLIEDHYGRPMDIEWAKDGITGDLFIVQSRPETVHAPGNGSAARILRTWRMDAALSDRLREEDKVILEGLAVGTRIGSGRVRMYSSYEEVIQRKRALRERTAAGEDLSDLPFEERVFDPGDVLVTTLTTPDWEPLMKEASLIITERGGRTSHAAIVAREFGTPAIVGARGALEILEPFQEVTGSCAEGETGVVFDGIHPYEIEEIRLEEGEPLETAIKLNVGFPGKAPGDAMLPSAGVGLARLEFILTAQVGIHPLALVWFDELKRFVETGDLGPDLEPFREQLRGEDSFELGTLLGAVERRIPGYDSPSDFFVDRVRAGVALICAAFYPRPVLVRLSDLKSNEYRDLLGGRLFEPHEENPMIGWRGAARYVDPRFAPAFDLELRALSQVRNEMGMDNLQLMVPFCRTPAEGKEVIRLLEARQLDPASGVPLFLMVEIPSNILEAEAFIEGMALTGGSIGSNDLVQTIYALSRDDLEGYADPPDARSPGVKAMIREGVKRFRAAGIEIGICGQAPSDHPDEVPPFLVECGISSISVTPDTFHRVHQAVRRAEGERSAAADRKTDSGRLEAERADARVDRIEGNGTGVDPTRNDGTGDDPTEADGAGEIRPGTEGSRSQGPRDPVIRRAVDERALIERMKRKSLSSRADAGANHHSGAAGDREHDDPPLTSEGGSRR